MAKEDYTISGIYQGGYSSLNPSYGSVFTGYRVGAGSIGLAIDPRTANILQEIQKALSVGAKHVEVGAVSPDVFESIPKQHLKEVNRISKLAGVGISVHAPIVEPSGISKQGFSEDNRKAAERQMFSAVERSHEINPDGNINVTFHSSAQIPQPITTKGKEVPEEIYIVNRERGSIHPFQLKEKAFPEEEGKIDIQKEIERVNQVQWSESRRNMSYYANIGEEDIKKSELLARTAEKEKEAGMEIVPAEREAKILFNRGRTFLDNSYMTLQELFETANTHCSKEDKKILNEFADSIRARAKELKKTKDIYEDARIRREIVDEGFEALGKVHPKLFEPLDDYAREKTIDSFANVAFNAYDKFRNTSPIISIENPPVGGAFSRGKELKELVEGARQKFIEKAVEKGISEDKARMAAEKVLGVTWDVGHINMLRRYGYESKDIVKEAKEVAPLVKHVHLSDNFGFEHTELPMGMGNVPIKEVLKELPEETKKVIEAGNWYQYQKTTPFQETLEAFGSQMYPTRGPYWNQVPGLWQGYPMGYGLMLPQVNYETFGGGFSQLPAELGGQRPGAQGSRMSGKPME